MSNKNIQPAGKVPKELTERNINLYQLHLDGYSFSWLAKKFGITPQRAFSIVLAHKKKYIAKEVKST